MTLRQSLFFDAILLPGGWASGVGVSVENGIITKVEAGATSAGRERVPGFALPGLPNLHCHTFQRAMAGLAERRGPADDTFWSWRDVMYRFVGQLTPDDVQAIAAFAYLEMLESGFTAVGEFHYLHHGPDGVPYANLAEMASRIVEGARETGIGLTLLPSLYTYGGFGGGAASEGQRRFLNSPDRFALLLEATRRVAASLPSTAVGIAPHSLRAVDPDGLRAVVSEVKAGPIHIHVAEQTREVDDCVTWSGRRPVEWLLQEMPVDGRWCLIHATHMTAEETRKLAASSAVAGLCPLTEASLGDGVFNGPAYLEAGGRYGVGSDSNIEIDAAGELRQLEYSQRLHHRARNVMTKAAGESTGARMLSDALMGGAQALGRPIGAIEVGRRADIVVLDAQHASFAASGIGHRLDTWIFSAGRSAVDTVLAGGTKVVERGRHIRRATIAERYCSTLKRLAGNV